METRRRVAPSTDSGCKYAAQCLNCPFDTCLYEIPGGKARFFKSRRNTEIIKQHQEWKTNAELARQFGTSIRSIQRILAADRHSKLNTEVQSV